MAALGTKNPPALQPVGTVGADHRVGLLERSAQQAALRVQGARAHLKSVQDENQRLLAGGQGANVSFEEMAEVALRTRLLELGGIERAVKMARVRAQRAAERAPSDEVLSKFEQGLERDLRHLEVASKRWLMAADSLERRRGEGMRLLGTGHALSGLPVGLFGPIRSRIGLWLRDRGVQGGWRS